MSNEVAERKYSCKPLTVPAVSCPLSQTARSAAFRVARVRGKPSAMLPRHEPAGAFTGRSIVGVSLQEQNDLCDAIARRFRAYTDGRRDAATGCSADSP